MKTRKSRARRADKTRKTSKRASVKTRRVVHAQSARNTGVNAAPARVAKSLRAQDPFLERESSRYEEPVPKIGRAHV